MIAYGAPIPNFQTGELEVHDDGTVSVKKSNGRYLCITPQGKEEERDSGGGPWETFKVCGRALLAERGDKTYVLPFVE